MLKCVLSGPASHVFYLVMEEQTFHPHPLPMSSDFVLISVQKYSVNTPPFSLVQLRFPLADLSRICAILQTLLSYPVPQTAP